MTAIPLIDTWLWHKFNDPSQAKDMNWSAEKSSPALSATCSLLCPAFYALLCCTVKVQIGLHVYSLLLGASVDSIDSLQSCLRVGNETRTRKERKKLTLSSKSRWKVKCRVTLTSLQAFSSGHPLHGSRWWQWSSWKWQKWPKKKSVFFLLSS